jgi:hemerythrin superfamily protein
MEGTMAKTQHGALNAIDLLHSDHDKVEQLFKEFESAENKPLVAKQIFNELEMHADLEEELFYPAILEAVRTEDLGEERGRGSSIERDTPDEVIAIAEAEHKAVKDHISALKQLRPETSEFMERFTELKDAVMDHVAEEEEVLFPAAMKKIDVTDLGAKMEERRSELAAQKAER